MNTTLQGIQEQFAYWRQSPIPTLHMQRDQPQVVVGCGTSYYLAQSIACALNEAGYQAVGVPGSEWTLRPRTYLGRDTPHVIALSRSGESTETVQAAIDSRKQGWEVTAITCEAQSSLPKNADNMLFSQTHPVEGIVMTSSASLMLLMGLRLAGYTYGETEIRAAEELVLGAGDKLASAIPGRSHFVVLGGGALFGVAQEGALKLQEMSLSYAQSFHPMEYRHGPMSLVDERTLIVMLYHPDSLAEETKLTNEMRSKGAKVIGFGGPGDVEFTVEGSANVRALTVLPCLQLFGELVAQSKGLDSVAPRHLSKVVTLA